MNRLIVIGLTALAPAIWGTTYIVTTSLLPDGDPLSLAALRALPAGLILLLVVRRLPPASQLGRIVLLGGLNFTLFWACLFLAAYRLPGGIAATVGAIQPLIVLLLARKVLNEPIRAVAVAAAFVGLIGVALLVLGPEAGLDPVGIAAGLAGAASMAAGTVYSRKWRGETPLLTFTAWQLTAGGLLLLPAAWSFGSALPPMNLDSLAGLVWLTLIGAALSYVLWFNGVGRLAPSTVSSMGFLSPLVAVSTGWLLLGESLSPVQLSGAALVLGGVCAATHSAPSADAARPRIATSPGSLGQPNASRRQEKSLTSPTDRPEPLSCPE
ncbi:EamA family transporter [Wenzhouxiangella marina]|uniref:Uncharacterized protein n=1 Tax=Wenzhouxiangella marina TaxID=1579979 RepID=A0A0K0XV13_9GAMM|nr:EamA family transporter [Wenzhouxiangella marina]AKS41505.1 hypothetical protein WM2015_1131 [Wenzhouxiangella marina]MBB6086736.1 putative blue pigment (indigoidine) exporter [Wenzhouxiangella marina]